MEFAKYFQKKADTQFQCTIKVVGDEGERECGDIITTTKLSSWNLKRHVSRKHEEVFRTHSDNKYKDKETQQLQAEGEQATFKKFFRAKTVPQQRKRELDEAFFKMVYMDYEPLTKGERDGMRYFANAAQPGYVPPCYSTIRDTLMPNAFAEMESKVRHLLEQSSGLSLAIDIWTSRRGHSFLGMVASFIDADFKGRTVLLSCEHIHGHHTADRIYEKYEEVLKRWNVQNGVIRVVTDSASNMVKAFNLPGFDDICDLERAEPDGGTDVEVDTPDEFLRLQTDHIASHLDTMVAHYIAKSNMHMRCPIHLLQLAIKDAIAKHDAVNSLLNKVGKLVKNIRKSSMNTEETDNLGVRPTTACMTRWNSQLRMIESVLKLFEKDALWQNRLTSSTTEDGKLTCNDVLMLKALVDVLTPLAELTDSLQKELGNLGMILPAVAEIRGMMAGVSHPLEIAAFAETLGNNFSSRYSRFYDDKHVLLAAVLDPRFKTEWITRDEQVRAKRCEIRDLLVHQTDQLSRKNAPVLPPPAHASALELDQSCSSKKARSMFQSYATTTQSSTLLDINGEIEQYITSARMNPDVDILQFWKEKAVTLPRLSQMARHVFCIPSGSASAERVFSSAGLMSSHHRMSLKPRTLQKLVFLKVNSAIGL